MRVGLQRWNAGSKHLALIVKLIALEHAADDLDALAHHSRGPNFFAFPFADFFHEDLRRAKAQQETVTREILHDARLHRNLDRMPRVWRNNSPTKLNAPSLARNDGENYGRRARFEGMFAPPGIGFGDPDRVQPRFPAGLGDGRGFADGFHPKLQHSDVEWNRPSNQVSGLRCQVSGKAKPAPC